MTDKKTPEEVVAGIIYDHFGDCMMIWERHLEQAEEILAALKYHEMVALILEKDKYIEFMQLRLRIAWSIEEKDKKKVEVLKKKVEVLQKEIENLKSDVELFMDLCDKKDEWLEVQRNQIAELKAEIENEYELAAYRSSCEP